MGYLGRDPPPQKEVMERKEKFVLKDEAKDSNPKCRSGKKAYNPSEWRDYGMRPRDVAVAWMFPVQAVEIDADTLAFPRPLAIGHCLTIPASTDTTADSKIFIAKSRVAQASSTGKFIQIC